MFKIAICDDEVYTCAQIEAMLLRYRKENLLDMQVSIFTSGEKLLKFLENEQVDLIYLDIQLNTLDGVRVGKIIRDEMKNEMVHIVYVSSRQDYAMELFEIRPINFLIKPLVEEKVIKSLKKSMELFNFNDNQFEIKVGRGYNKFFFKDIIYFENNLKKIMVVTTTDTFGYYGKFTDLTQMVLNKNFLLIHRSYLVNYMHIIEYQYEYVVVIGGHKLPISNGYRKDVRTKLLKKMKGENGL